MRRLTLLLLLCGCGVVIPAKPQLPPRFVLVSEEYAIRFEGLPVYEPRGTVHRDSETGMEYLYMWSGAGNGGPALTRLWKKGE